jgi:hypothetical protein
VSFGVALGIVSVFAILTSCGSTGSSAGSASSGGGQRSTAAFCATAHSIQRDNSHTFPSVPSRSAQLARASSQLKQLAAAAPRAVEHDLNVLAAAETVAAGDHSVTAPGQDAYRSAQVGLARALHNCQLSMDIFLVSSVSSAGP